MTGASFFFFFLEHFIAIKHATTGPGLTGGALGWG